MATAKESSQSRKNIDQIKKLLYSLARAGDSQNLGKKLEKLNIDINLVYSDRRTLLMLAAEKGDQKALLTLLKLKCELDIQNSYGETAAMFAVKAQRQECLQILIDHGTNLELTNENQETVADLALKHGLKDVSEKISKAGCVDRTCQTNALLPASATLSVDIEKTWEVITLEECQRLESLSLSDSSMFQTERRARITSDNFGEIFYIEETINSKVLHSLFVEQKPTEPWERYRVDNIDIAKARYITKTKNHVHAVGLVVHPEIPFLAAAPTGRICSYPDNELGIVYIKCLYGIRDMLIADAAKRETFCLHKGKSNYTLKKRHKFYLEIQGLLMITGAPFCDFVLYTRRDLQVIRIFHDETVQEDLLEKLVDFYFQHAMKYLQQL